MRYSARASIVFFCIIIIFPLCVYAQDTTGKKLEEKELTIIQFQEEFFFTLADDESERLRQLVAENPNIARQLYLDWKFSIESGELSPEQAERFEELVEIFLNKGNTISP